MIMTKIDFNTAKQGFMREFEDYIGADYIARNYILLGDSTRFDQLKFDIVDEVVTEHLINQHFGLDGFACDEWPSTLGDLMQIVESHGGNSGVQV